MHASATDASVTPTSPPPIAAGPGPRWSVASWQALVHCLLLFVAVGAGVVAMSMALSRFLPAPDSHPLDGSTGAFLRMVIRGVLTIGLITWLGQLAVARLRWRDIGWYGLSMAQVGRGLVGFALTAAAFIAFLVVATGSSLGEILSAIADQTWQQRLLFVGIGVTASVIEESLMRGYLQPSLCKYLGGPVGIVVTAVVFSLLHVPSTLVAFGGRLVIGLGLGFTRGVGERRPLWSAAIVHTLIWVVIGAM
ncbi:CPBP family intramembrane glutamic endopeptidase [Haliangium sp.]|uniref:CPBP family intramembrane glutamic endopeptidase n=1 Tax=Haliangium sp. TaxID=2663208 RepID=UPI003D14E8A3